MSSTSQFPQERTHGLNVRQWSLLVISFCLGITSVFVIDHLFFGETTNAGVVQAATASP